ncbi:MAG: Crp/Fnr family transcriptional regulator [Chitinophagaceae bacterium]|nr:Crp/Fnr family transcriptional regulator [Chitinophagaceae bacterium]MCA6471379.1 Crp/Fnr family transcriptional regulator [Chitinophagaceae bacterium]MCA6477950.1 Crp/Fnr family transcriptional regulator [Chitinophagaceae bacterium]MCA6479655.1 Crp/Fnr family transcriptional regulator [Chitinophagaceae bacterium]MCA6488841.1 Crp/Fnr family transcriptional regulator [Chitinophagaceae bacterium]
MTDVNNESAITSFLDSVKSLCPNISDLELNYLESGITVSNLTTKQFYIEANSIQRVIGFVYRGLLRSFYVNNGGDEITVNFIRERKYATHFSAFITQTPCKYFFQCIENTIIVNLSYQHIQEGYNRFPLIERYGRLIAEEVLKTQQKRIEGFLFDNAETRYLDFVKENPNLFNRVSLTFLSSFLGIERQTLTRIRQKLAQQKF